MCYIIYVMKNFGIETETIEFKKSTRELREGIISLSAMLNKHGYGALYFGIKDDGSLCGQDVSGKTLRDISQAISNYIKPQVIPTIKLELIDTMNVISVEASGLDSPYSAFGKYYMRSADEDRELSPAALRDLMVRKSKEDILTNIESPRQDLCFAKLKMAYIEHGLTVDNDTFELNAGLKNSAGKYNYMAYLLADSNDISIKVATFAGVDKTKLIIRNEYGDQCLINAMNQVFSYVESINETKVQLGHSVRGEEKLFDLSSFKEAWQNACLHSRWDKGNPPAVYVFSDRLEIISTGGLAYDLSREEFYKGISRPVNMKLQKIFGQLGYVEQTGHGVPLIISNYGKTAFDIMDNYINVTIPFNFARYRQEHISYELEENAPTYDAGWLVLNEIKKNPGVTIREISAQVGYSEIYVRKLIAELKHKNKLERVGGRKEGYWRVKSN